MVDIRIVTIKYLPRGDVNKFLWEMLKERDPTINISHKEMPTWSNHCEFVDRHHERYRDWCIITTIPDGKWVGQVYLTHQREIGIHLIQEAQHQGIASEALQRMIKSYGPGKFYANISPKNLRSHDFFAKNGFKLMQYTYELVA